MLGRINQAICMQAEAPRPLHSEDKWQRNEKDDVKTAIDYLYEFKEKLSKLHPTAQATIEHLLMPIRY